MAIRKTTGRGRAKTPKEWTPQMQFSKRIARVITVYWLTFVTAVFIVLVFFRAIDAMMALTGWVTAVMITMVGAYTGNSMYEKHLDKGIDKGFYVPKLEKKEDTDNEEIDSDSAAEDEGNG